MKLVIILVEPQMGENIGLAARAMGNFDLLELRLVNPRDPWPNPKAVQASAGADFILDKAEIFSSTREAMADLDYVFATTLRPRRMEKKVFSAKQMPKVIQKTFSQKAGILFGPEKAGLSNEDISLCNGIITIQTVPSFSSLNLAHSVALCAYEWHQSKSKKLLQDFKNKSGKKASKGEVNLFLSHLEEELDKTDFLLPAHKRERMVWNLRSIFERIELTEQEVRTLRGIIKSLSLGKTR
jgi:tRNA/rRNA methyltransferase